MLSPISVPASRLHRSAENRDSSTSPASFTMVPDTVLCDPDLSYAAKTLYALILHHARPDRGGVCIAGYDRICHLMNAGEDLVRTAFGELRAMNLVAIQRRGQGRTNVVRPLVITPPRTGRNRGQDPAVEGDELEQRESNEEESFEVSRAHSPHAVSLSPMVTTQEASNPSPRNDTPPHTKTPAKRPPALPPDAHRMTLMPYVRDIARELHDNAPLPASVTRVCRLHRQSGLSLEEFIGRMMNARHITQERSHVIRDRDGRGFARKFAYWCEVLRDQCGLRAAEVPPQTMRAHASPVSLPAPLPPAPVPVMEISSGTGTNRVNTGVDEGRQTLFASLTRFGVEDAGSFIRRYGFGPFGDYNAALKRALAWERQHGNLSTAQGVWQQSVRGAAFDDRPSP